MITNDKTSIIVVAVSPYFLEVAHAKAASHGETLSAFVRRLIEQEKGGAVEATADRLERLSAVLKAAERFERAYDGDGRPDVAARDLFASVRAARGGS